MRKKTIAAVICLLLLLTLSGTALASEPGDSGFYGIGTASGLSVEPLTPGGTRRRQRPGMRTGTVWRMFFTRAPRRFASPSPIRRLTAPI